MDEDFRKAALDYHRLPHPGKLEVVPTKRMATQRDLALAYSPGVAAACEAIKADPLTAYDYTARGNLVGVVSNGTAVLGLGNIGALAGKPVMEGKAVLFKKFAGIDCFDIEVDAADPERFIEVVQALEPTFGAINLEDIKAPECFGIERRLRETMKIPVFHDDQHGTAIIVAAAVRNGLELQGKRLEDVRLVTSGAGAAALACVDLLVTMGLNPANVTLTDIKGVIYAGRDPDMLPNMANYANPSNARTLPEALPGADIFLGLSAPRVLKAEWLHLLGEKPLILALANPEPEILPEAVRAARPDAIVATGRSDYPNQVNNVLCFPFIFRGALDVGATTINEEMKVACVEAIAVLARVEASEVVAAAYGGAAPVFGPDYIIPKPFDPRLILQIAPAVAQAAMRTGVATRPIEDFAAYRRELEVFVYRSGQLMRPVFEAARKSPRRIVYADGEDERVLRAVQTIVDEGIAQPILIGRRGVIASRVAGHGPAAEPRPKRARARPGAGPRGVRPADRGLPAAGRAPRRAPGCRSAADAQPGDGGGLDAAACRAGGCSDRRRLRRLAAAPGLRVADHTQAVDRVAGICLVRADPQQRGAVLLRHPCHDRPYGGGGRGDDAACRRSGEELRHRAQGGVAVALLLRRRQLGACPQDAPRPGFDPRPGAGVGGGRRDARRRGVERGDPRPRRAGQPAFRYGQLACDAGSGRGKHRVQSSQGER